MIYKLRSIRKDKRSEKSCKKRVICKRMMRYNYIMEIKMILVKVKIAVRERRIKKINRKIN